MSATSRSSVEVEGLPDDAHAALAELLDEAVAAEDEVFSEVHGASLLPQTLQE
ncbi:MAG: hypothetical protein MZV64_63185 [Ignavibacteriales bacterium]|nr:hypothetical protein [Ignavibacteriales bacterium]